MGLRTVHKPAGIPVLAPHGDPSGDCVLRRLLVREPWRAEVPWPAGFEGGIAHRLDVSTSGAVAVADDLETLIALREAFSARKLRKAYLLWAARDVPWSAHRCDRPLAHDRRRRARMVVQRSSSTPHRGRWLAAETAFERVGGHLWRARMSTGVMHQIRLHAAFVGLAIRGDRLYGGGAPPPDAPPGLTFYLHHEGFEGAGFRTPPVPEPGWARDAASDRSTEGPA